VTSTHDAGETIAQMVAGRPAPALRRFVSSYTGYHFQGFAPGTHRGLPSRALTFVVAFDEPLDLAGMPDPAQRPGRFVALVGGLHAHAATIRHQGDQHGLQLAITPAGARALLGRPAAELASTVVALDDVWGRRAGELVERLTAAPGWAERFAVLDEVFGRRAAAAPDRRGAPDEVAYAWDRLAGSSGAAPVTEVAREAGWSRRHLSERFRTEYGLPPKVMARVFRFERARMMLQRPGPPSLARVAAECGYADQAHLTREWRDLAGATPTAWMSSEQLPIVQDGEALERAS
jgi:AraC-like DNA-binding protein